MKHYDMMNRFLEEQVTKRKMKCPYCKEELWVGNTAYYCNSGTDCQWAVTMIGEGGY